MKRVKRPIKRLFSARLFYAVLLIALQGVMLFYFFSYIMTPWQVELGFTVVSAVLGFWLVSKYENDTYKLTWILIILLLPSFGWLIYLICGSKAAGRPLFKKVRKVTYKGEIVSVAQNDKTLGELEDKDASAARIAQYISDFGRYPLYDSTETEFLESGEKWYEKLLCELSRAEKFIFLEFFTIEEGIMWGGILDILVKKAAEGVDVRVIYDDLGCIKTLPWKYDGYLRSLGIRCHIFNRIVPVFSVRHNNRDHRKICVIDGKTAFTGGINIADEYINKKERYGHWLDTGIMLRGPAVRSMTVMFVSVWDFLDGKKDIRAEDYFSDETFGAGGYCIPYADSPYGGKDLAANVYIHMIARAKKYIYITTPYLVIDFAMEQALRTAAQSGVDVRILFPGIPDKRITYEVARGKFAGMIKAGVKIYSYTPGFVHSKTFVSDDDMAVVGTINLDYRSLYLHFENAVLLYNTASVGDVKRFFIKRMHMSHLLTAEETRNVNIFVKLLRIIFTPFSPLL